MLKAIYPGSFDPVTYGHLDIIRRSSKLVDELIVGVLCNKAKMPLFSVEYELQMSQTNHKLEPNVETMFLTTSIEYSYLSSTTVREIAAFGGDLSQFVPEAVAVELRKKMNTKGECNK